MSAAPLGLQMLWWAQVVVSARILIFLLPVMINQSQGPGIPLYSADDGFLGVATLTSLLYLLVGIMALLGNKSWKLFYYVVAFLVAALTARSQQLMAGQSAVNIVYLLPLFFAGMITVGINLFRTNPRGT